MLCVEKTKWSHSPDIYWGPWKKLIVFSFWLIRIYYYTTAPNFSLLYSYILQSKYLLIFTFIKFNYFHFLNFIIFCNNSRYFINEKKYEKKLKGNFDFSHMIDEKSHQHCYIWKKWKNLLCWKLDCTTNMIGLILWVTNFFCF
jgi:hypothetical protein